MTPMLDTRFAPVIEPAARLIRRSQKAVSENNAFSYRAGLILFCILGLGPLAAVLLVWLRHPLAPFAAMGVGVALLIWMAVEIAIIGYSNNPPLQPLYLLLGAVITGVGLGWQASLGPPAPRSR